MSTTRTLTLPPPTTISNDGRGSIFFIGTATTIVRLAGFTILTDPNFLHRGDHVHLGYGLRSKRLTEPAIDFDMLPQLDLAIVSHLHEDHFDRIAEQRLDKNLPIVTTPHAAEALRGKGFQKVHRLSSWESLLVSNGEADLRITAMPGRHGPPLVSKLLPPVMGSMLEFRRAGEPLLCLYITGDTEALPDGRHRPHAPGWHPDRRTAAHHGRGPGCEDDPDRLTKDGDTYSL
jgi:L-ascorbate metabolism protein UlaG (beta-lactamase superfamily)